MAPKNGKRNATLPIKPYLYKWLINRHGYNEILLINQRFFPYYPHNQAAVEKYFLNEEGYPTIRVSAYYPDHRALYSFAQMLKLWFNSELLNYVRYATIHGYPARTACRNFLKLCRITEDELPLDTVYKRWQRSEERLPGVKVA